MNYINFVSCGALGDFIHCLSVVKNICEKQNVKANIYLSNDKSLGAQGVNWTFSAEKANEDLKELVLSQSYVNKFEFLPSIEYLKEEYVNLNKWRNTIINSYNNNSGCYTQSWSEFLSECYKYEIHKPYKWINIEKTDNELKDKIVIHRSLVRHNNSFNWNAILEQLNNEEIIFLTCSIPEWEGFPYKKDNVKLKLVSTIEEMAIGINSSKLFIGNQSSPFALASALDVNRLVELVRESAPFYIAENKYSENISWYFKDDKKYFTDKSLLKL